jgi:hypothetical protein
MVQYAESMVKLENNAAFCIMCPQEELKEDNKAKLRPALYVRTNAGKKARLSQQQSRGENERDVTSSTNFSESDGNYFINFYNIMNLMYDRPALKPNTFANFEVPAKIAHRNFFFGRLKG